MRRCPAPAILPATIPLPGDGNSARLEDRAAFSAGTDMEDRSARHLGPRPTRTTWRSTRSIREGSRRTNSASTRTSDSTTDSSYLRSTMDTLRTLAINTDGRAIVNRNDLTMGMKQIVRDNSAYYLLGYNSTFTATDGKFHEIKVKVNRPGMQVRARKGYWAFTADDAARALAPPKADAPKAVDTAIAAITTPSRSRVVRTWIGSERGADGKTKITFVWEPVPRAPGDPVRPESTPARVSITAVAPDGSPYYRGKIPEGSSATPAPAGSKISFDVKPGKMQLRVSVESAGADVLDSEVREIAVPDLTAPQIAIGTPAVYRGRTVPEYQRLKADAQAMPTAAREFSRTERVFIRVPAYAPGTSAPTVTAKLLNRTGQSMGDLTVSPSAGRPDSKDIELSLAPMPPGEYVVEITATGEGEPVKELVGFRLTADAMRLILALALALSAGAPLPAAETPRLVPRRSTWSSKIAADGSSTPWDPRISPSSNSHVPSPSSRCGLFVQAQRPSACPLRQRTCAGIGRGLRTCGCDLSR